MFDFLKKKNHPPQVEQVSLSETCFLNIQENSQKEKPVDYNESPKRKQGPFRKIPMSSKIWSNISGVS